MKYKKEKFYRVVREHARRGVLWWHNASFIGYMWSKRINTHLYLLTYVIPKQPALDISISSTGCSTSRVFTA